MSLSEVLAIRSKFKVNKPDGTVINLRIQDIRKCDIKKVVEYIPKHFIKEEIWCKCAGVSDNIEATEEIMDHFNKLLETTTVRGLICCIDNTDNEITIVGHNLLKITKKTDPQKDFVRLMKTDGTKRFFTIIREIYKIYDVFDDYKKEQYLDGAGLSVDKDYRGLGIATELLKARRPLMLELGISITGAWMTSEGSQRASIKAGYEVIKEINKKELEHLVGFDFEHGPGIYQLAVLIL